MAEYVKLRLSNQQGRVRCPLWPMWAVHSAVHPSSALYVRWVGVNEYWPNQGRVLSESQWLRESLGTLYIRGYGHGFGQKIIQGYPGHNWGQSISNLVAGSTIATMKSIGIAFNVFIIAVFLLFTCSINAEDHIGHLHRTLANNKAAHDASLERMRNDVRLAEEGKGDQMSIHPRRGAR
ncbi:hypothetical protein Ddc_17971 [Ditylenchus destructor]|nr:hypothetical protein Ddc_17971 [Ditylenchus destructor]